ncbi:hypothetical protein HPSAT_03440 [Helicobacter pylori Sat464]|nr:hypothetical protein HPSAT_03440 [Helicobacter pylori Sat464]
MKTNAFYAPPILKSPQKQKKSPSKTAKTPQKI